VNPQLSNVLVGVLQVAVPAAVTFAVGKGWITADMVTFWGSVLAGLGFTGWSATTTKAVAPTAVKPDA